MLFHLLKGLKYSTLSSSRVAIRETHTKHTKRVTWNHLVFASYSLFAFASTHLLTFTLPLKTTERALNTVHKSISAKDVKDKFFQGVFLFDGVKLREIILVFPVMGSFINIQCKNNVEVS